MFQFNIITYKGHIVSLKIIVQYLNIGKIKPSNFMKSGQLFEFKVFSTVFVGSNNMVLFFPRSFIMF